MTESLPLVPVPVGDCRCPGTPHEDGDVVFLYPKLGMEGGSEVAMAAFNQYAEVLRGGPLAAKPQKRTPPTKSSRRGPTSVTST